MATKHYVVQTTDPSIGTTKIAVSEMIAAGFETTWLATREPYTDRQRQTRTLEASLFPGYLFVAFDAGQETWKTIRLCRGVRGILGLPERPTALPDGCLELLRARFNAGEFKVKHPSSLSIGDLVVVEVGPDRNMIGTVTISRGDRVRVLFEFLGHQQSWIGVDRVRRVAG